MTRDYGTALAASFGEAGEILGAHDEIPDAFFDVLDTDWNAACLYTTSGDLSSAWGDITGVALSVIFEFHTRDDAAVFAEWCREYADAQHDAGDDGIKSVSVKTPTPRPRLEHSVYGPVGWVTDPDPPRVTVKFVGRPVRETTLDGPGGPLPEPVVAFAEALAADELDDDTDDGYSFPAYGAAAADATDAADAAAAIEGGIDVVDGEHATELVGPSTLVAEHIQTSALEVLREVSAEVQAEFVSEMLRKANIDEDEILAELEGEKTAAVNLGGDPQDWDAAQVEKAAEEFGLTTAEIERIRDFLKTADADDRRKAAIHPSGNVLKGLLAAADEQDAEDADAAEQDATVCPSCGSENTVAFSTGDRVCRECNHNYDPPPIAAETGGGD